MSDDSKSMTDTARHYLQLAESFGKERADLERESHLSLVRSAEMATKQAALLIEANELAKEARADAEIARKETQKATKRAFWANLIAILSFLVAAASLTLAAIQYLSNGT